MVRTLVLIIALFALIVALWMIKDEKLSKKLKATITAFIAFGVGFAYFYENSTNIQNEKNIKILANFNQQKIIKCGEYNVNKAKFNYEFGTAVFMAKPEIDEIRGIIIPISKCEND